MNGLESFSIISLSMMNQTSKFHPLAIIDRLKGLNGLDCIVQMDPIGIQKWSFIHLDFFFSNISKSVINKWLIFDPVAFLGSLNMIIGSGLA